MMNIANTSTMIWAGFSQLVALLFLFAAMIKFWEYIADALVGKTKSK
ncbi:MAG: hypothetical protein LBH81_01670 [Rickettsiales bacterium]|nr:hypothetical protein [Rickettsiales bacterium]